MRRSWRLWRRSKKEDRSAKGAARTTSRVSSSLAPHSVLRGLLGSQESKTLRVLGIDCGTERTGWGVIDSDGRRHRVVAHGVIRMATTLPLEQRLAKISAGLRSVLSDHRPDAAAVEGIFYSQNVKTALKLAHVRGVALLAICEAGVALGEYSPLEVKSSVVGYGRAEKQQVELMVRTLTGFEDPFASADASDALAVAICHAVSCPIEVIR